MPTSTTMLDPLGNLDTVEDYGDFQYYRGWSYFPNTLGGYLRRVTDNLYVRGEPVDLTYLTTTFAAAGQFAEVGAEVAVDATAWYESEAIPFNGQWDPVEDYQDLNSNGHWDAGEPWVERHVLAIPEWLQGAANAAFVSNYDGSRFIGLQPGVYTLTSVPNGAEWSVTVLGVDVRIEDSANNTLSWQDEDLYGALQPVNDAQNEQTGTVTLFSYLPDNAPVQYTLSIGNAGIELWQGGTRLLPTAEGALAVSGLSKSQFHNQNYSLKGITVTEAQIALAVEGYPEYADTVKVSTHQMVMRGIRVWKTGGSLIEIPQEDFLVEVHSRQAFVRLPSDFVEGRDAIVIDWAHLETSGDYDACIFNTVSTSGTPILESDKIKSGMTSLASNTTAAIESWLREHSTRVAYTIIGSSGQATVNLYHNVQTPAFIAPTSSKSTTLVSYKLNVTRTNMDVNRPGVGTVPEEMEGVEGSITKVPNPNEDTDDASRLSWQVNLSGIRAIPEGLLVQRYILNASTRAGVNDGWQLFHASQRVSEFPYSVQPEEADAEFSIVFTGGCIVDFDLSAEITTPDGATWNAGTDTVRVTSIGCAPMGGRVRFVNPASTSPSQPGADHAFTDPFLNAAHTVKSAFAILEDGDNLVLFPSIYEESRLTLMKDCVVAGIPATWVISSPLEPCLIPYVPVLSRIDHAPWIPQIRANLVAPILDAQDHNARISFIALNGGKGNDYGAILSTGGAIDLEAVDISGCQVARSTGGGAIHKKTGQLRVADSRLSGNSGKSNGGAIGVFDVELRIERSFIDGNTARRSGISLASVPKGAGIYLSGSESTFLMVDSVFSGNAVIDTFNQPDIGMIVTPPESIDDSPRVRIVSDDVGAFGGAVCAVGMTLHNRIERCLFAGNSAQSGWQRARGGAIYVVGDNATSQCPLALENIIFRENCTIVQSNGTRSTGGAIHCKYASVTATSILFDRNVSEGYVSVLPQIDDPSALFFVPHQTTYGGAIGLQRDTTFTAQGCGFIGNASSGAAGAIGLVGDSEAITGEASGYTPDQGRQELRLTSCNFEGNVSSLHGGAIAVACSGSSASLISVSFTSNSCTSPGIDGDGSAIAFQSTDYRLYINDGRFVNNSSGNGGTIKLGGLADAYLLDCSFFTNVAQEGGAIRLSTAASVAAEDCSFFNNISSGYGGAVSAKNSDVVLSGEGTHFYANSSMFGGGAIHYELGRDPFLVQIVLAMHSMSLLIEDGVWLMLNFAGQSGGAMTIVIDADGDSKESLFSWVMLELGISNAKFTSNMSDSGASDIELIRQSTHKISGRLSGCDFSGMPSLTHMSSCRLTNESVFGGVASSPTWTMESCVLSGYGLGLVSAYMPFDLYDCTFTEAPANAVAVEITGSPVSNDLVMGCSQTITISNCRFNMTSSPSPTGIMLRRPGASLDNMTNIRVANSSFLGMQVDLGQSFLHGGIRLDYVPSTSVDATFCYWDSADGPQDSTNRNSSGSFVDYGVTFDPFLNAEPIDP